MSTSIASPHSSNTCQTARILTAGIFGTEYVAQMIFNFLNASQNETDLRCIGLHPEQLNKEISESVLPYFEKFCVITNACNNPKKVITCFKELYPRVHQSLRKKSVEAQLAQEKGCQNPQKRREEILQMLRTRVKGQENAIQALASKLCDQEERPPNIENTQVYLYAGPTGVGKTELAETAALVKGGIEEHLVKFSMEKFNDKHHADTFFGVALGVVGCEDKPIFAQKLHQLNPPPKMTHQDAKTISYEVCHAVILFDEFEKAAAKIKDTLLNLFDKRRCECYYVADRDPSSPGKTTTLFYTFKNCVMIGTSNLLQKEIVEAFKRQLPVSQIEAKFNLKQNLEEPDKRYTPELLARMTTTVFNPIPSGPVYQELLGLKLYGLFSLLKEKGFSEVECDNKENVLQALEKQLYGDGTNMRDLKGGFFEKINVALDQEMANWGNRKTKKIIFTSDAIEIHMSGKVFDSDACDYVRIASFPYPDFYPKRVPNDFNPLFFR